MGPYRWAVCSKCVSQSRAKGIHITMRDGFVWRCLRNNKDTINVVEGRTVDESKKEESVAGGVDPATLHARLKERFREHLNWFRDAVYLLTGFKVDMQGLGEGHPQVRLRSMFAEREDDSLLFAWSDDGVNLLATPFADQLDERLFANLKFCNSVPAFLASVQLNLFERQTLFPG